MTQQKVILILSETGAGYKVKLEFVPPLAGKEKFATMTDARKKIQTFAANIANSVMNALNKQL